jgi:hypothetical protein
MVGARDVSRVFVGAEAAETARGTIGGGRKKPWSCIVAAHSDRPVAFRPSSASPAPYAPCETEVGWVSTSAPCLTALAAPVSAVKPRSVHSTTPALHGYVQKQGLVPQASRVWAASVYAGMRNGGRCWPLPGCTTTWQQLGTCHLLTAGIRESLTEGGAAASCATHAAGRASANGWHRGAPLSQGGKGGTQRLGRIRQHAQARQEGALR